MGGGDPRGKGHPTTSACSSTLDFFETDSGPRVWAAPLKAHFSDPPLGGTNKAGPRDRPKLLTIGLKHVSLRLAPSAPASALVPGGTRRDPQPRTVNHRRHRVRGTCCAIAADDDGLSSGDPSADRIHTRFQHSGGASATCADHAGVCINPRKRRRGSQHLGALHKVPQVVGGLEPHARGIRTGVWSIQTRNWSVRPHMWSIRPRLWGAGSRKAFQGLGRPWQPTLGRGLNGLWMGLTSLEKGPWTGPWKGLRSVRRPSKAWKALAALGRSLKVLGMGLTRLWKGALDMALQWGLGRPYQALETLRMHWKAFQGWGKP